MSKDIEVMVKSEEMSQYRFEEVSKKICLFVCDLDLLQKEIEALCEYEYEVDNCESREETKYWEAKVTVQEYEIKERIKKIVDLYKKQFSGFIIKEMQNVTVREISQICGVNKELLGSAKEKDGTGK